MIMRSDALMLCAARILSSQELGLPKDVAYLRLPQYLLDGAIQSEVPFLVANELVYAATTRDEVKLSYGVLAAHYRVKTVEFDVIEAWAGEELVHKVFGGAAT